MKEEEVEQILDKRTHQGQPEYRGTVKVAVLVGTRPATTGGSSGCIGRLQAALGTRDSMVEGAVLVGPRLATTGSSGCIGRLQAALSTRGRMVEGSVLVGP